AVAAVGMAMFLAAGMVGFGNAVAERRELLQLAVWAVPTSVAWLVYGAYDFRLLAPAWPPLLALIVLAALPAATAFARRGALVAAVPVALFAVVVAENAYNLDGLGRRGWSALRGPSRRPHPAPTPRVAPPPIHPPRVRRRARANAAGRRHGFARRRVPLLLPRARRAVVSERLRVPPPLPRVRAHDRRGNAALHARLPARLARSVVLGGLQAAPSDTADRRLERVRRLPGGELMRVGVLTTSYPRHPCDTAGRFLADAVEHVRRGGVDVEVVGPEQFRGFGLTYGHGVVGNLRRRPWLTLFVPGLLASFVRAARRVDADLLHAHWLPSGWVAAHAGKPAVLQVWGTDVERARRPPRLARGVLRRARLVIAASTALADSARELGAGHVEVIPSGVDLPQEIGEEADPPEVLYAGRLSAEK